MKAPYDVLRRKYNSCPLDCSLCEQACATRKDSLGAVIKAIHAPEVNFHGVMVCSQCAEPYCMEICPTGAIVKSEEDGVVRIKQEKCVGCGMCTLACPYGGINYNSEMKVSAKCDMCDGKPVCVEACPYGVLDVFSGSRVMSYFQDEDLLTPGTGLCTGCPGEVGLRFTLRVLGRDIVFFGCAGCVAPMMIGFDMKSGSKVTCFQCLFTNVAATMSGVNRYYRHIGREVKLVAFVGDGCVTDIEFQGFSGAAERGENIIVICYDNEAYMATGILQSSTTPLGASTTTSPVGEWYHGKPQRSKDVPLIMVSHRIPYVATANIAYLEDYARKLTKAMNVKDGMAYIHLLSPCPLGWGAPLDSGIDISRAAVETNYFPLWEYENGKLHLTQEISAPRPVQEFTKLMRRFSHLTEEELGQFQEFVNDKLARIKALALVENL